MVLSQTDILNFSSPAHTRGHRYSFKEAALVTHLLITLARKIAQSPTSLLQEYLTLAGDAPLVEFSLCCYLDSYSDGFAQEFAHLSFVFFPHR